MKAVPLEARVVRLQDAGLLGTKPVREAVVEFNATCEGLANAELRGATLPMLAEGEEERLWRGALVTVVRGFAAAGPTPPRRRSGGR